MPQSGSLIATTTGNLSGGCSGWNRRCWQPAEKPTNIAKHFYHEKGDVEQGFAEASIIVEREFTTSTVHQGYIEPHNATAHWNADGHITIWMSTQGT
ncbi:MAG: molybdopterin-dependent oxidoreductase, partial [Planctomycetes bacterium]|nr:molybdopterin-dependent oxidoreductase [Planctomycetota bacterium]